MSPLTKFTEKDKHLIIRLIKDLLEIIKFIKNNKLYFLFLNLYKIKLKLLMIRNKFIRLNNNRFNK